MVDSAVAEPLGADDPQEIGSFNVIGLLGVGGMGEVYLGASDRGYAAVKRVRSRLVSHERFEREVGILYRVPAGVGPRVLASDSTAERPWFATEYVPGLTVDEAVRLRGPLPADALWLLLAEAAAHLSAVHDFGIAHRDVKPGNVMLVRDGVKLIDFGIARAADQSRLTRSGGSYGTQGFSAPEQQAGDEDVAAPADVYALGALALYAASGRTPGVVPDSEPLRAVDPDLAALVGSCLATAPGDRPTAAEVAKQARAHLPAPPPSWPSEVMARIAARRAFASTPVGKLETVPPPDLEAEPAAYPTADPKAGPETDRKAGPETDPKGADPTADPKGADLKGAAPTADPTPATVPPPAAASPRRARRYLRPLLAAAAVIAVGAVAAIVFVPPASRQDDAAHPSGGSSATAESSTGTAQKRPSPSPSRSASAGAESGRPTGDAQDDPHTSAPPSATGTRPPDGSRPTTAPPTAAPRVTSSPIAGVNGGDDPDQVPGSEADTTWVGNNAACSAWLRDNGSGELAGVLNTSLNQSCHAALHRDDGIAYTFHASWGAAKTNFISDVGHTMWICVWNADDRSDEQCSPRFAMKGNTPVKQ